jgi:hypothetical protein
MDAREQERMLALHMDLVSCACFLNFHSRLYLSTCFWEDLFSFCLSDQCTVLTLVIYFPAFGHGTLGTS